MSNEQEGSSYVRVEGLSQGSRDREEAPSNQAPSGERRAPHQRGPRIDDAQRARPVRREDSVRRVPFQPTTALTRSQYWCFVINNWTSDEEQRLSRLVADGEATYVVFGREVGESGTPHLQGYIEVPTRQRTGQLEQLLGGRAALFARNGTADEAAKYCKKDDDFEEFGTYDATMRPGKRCDLCAIQDEIKEGVSERDIADNHFTTWVIHRRAFREYRELIAPPDGDRLDLRVIMLWGASNTGKSFYAMHRYPDTFRVDHSDLSWFTGYKGQSTVVIDDYRGDAGESFILRLLDVYPLQVKVHYGMQPFRATTIFMTTNLQPSQLHNFDNAESRAAFQRRFHCVIHFPPCDPDERMSFGRIDRLVDDKEFNWV